MSPPPENLINYSKGILNTYLSKCYKEQQSIEQKIN